jgi:hypothetical protein
MAITISHYLLPSGINIIRYIRADNKAAACYPIGKDENFSG